MGEKAGCARVLILGIYIYIYICVCSFVSICIFMFTLYAASEVNNTICSLAGYVYAACKGHKPMRDSLTREGGGP